MHTPLGNAAPQDDKNAQERRHLLTATTAMAGAGAIAAAIPFVGSFEPSERARALGGSVEVNVAEILPGNIKTVAWRGKPVWIMRRTQGMIDSLKNEVNGLVDPGSQMNQQPEYARNSLRSVKEDVLVVLGICTHLGCSPNLIAAGNDDPRVGKNWNGGFLCPCHGSTFDFAGRVFLNKHAPTNLEVPPHKYLNATRLLIGEDDLASS